MYDYEFAALGEKNWDSAQQERYNDLTALLEQPPETPVKRHTAVPEIYALNLTASAWPDRMPVSFSACRLLTGDGIWLDGAAADCRSFRGITLAPAAIGDAVPVQLSGVISVPNVQGSVAGSYLVPCNGAFHFTNLPTRAQVLGYDAASGEVLAFLTAPPAAYCGYFLLDLRPDGILRVVDGAVYDGVNLTSGGVNRCYVNNQLYEVSAYEFPSAIAAEGDVYLQFVPETETFSFGFGTLPANTDTECYALLGQVKYAGNSTYRVIQRHCTNVPQLWWSRLCL